MPKNNLHLQDTFHRQKTSMTEEKFRKIIDHVAARFRSFVEGHNSSLVQHYLWDNPTVNAYAYQEFNTWNLVMYGGLARRPEITEDGFAMVVCHELGHHLAGYPFYGEGWAASEGQSDYFASFACAKRIWTDRSENAKFRQKISYEGKRMCDSVWNQREHQDLCYRSLMAGKSVATLLGNLNGDRAPEFETPSEEVVTQTNTSHPRAQCRLDTYVQGALCAKNFNYGVIPARSHYWGQATASAEVEASAFSCTRLEEYGIGKRPRCWFAPENRLEISESAILVREGDESDHNNIPGPGDAIRVAIPAKSKFYHRQVDGAWARIEVIDGARIFSNPTVLYGNIGSGSIQVPDNFLDMGISWDHRCGQKIEFKTKIQYDLGYDVSKFHFRSGKFTNLAKKTNNNAIMIPDNDPNGITSSLQVDEEGLATLIKVKVEIRHSYIGDVSVSLVSPEQRSYLLLPRDSEGGNPFIKTFELDTNQLIQGEWQLKVSDHARDDVGALKEWRLELLAADC